MPRNFRHRRAGLCAGLIGLAALAGCATDDARGPAPSSQTAPGAHAASAADATKTPTAPPHAVDVGPAGPRADHPLAPESLPGKPEAIPEQMPGSGG